MKKFVVLSVIFSLVVSLAAPYGAVFALEGEGPVGVPDAISEGEGVEVDGDKKVVDSVDGDTADILSGSDIAGESSNLEAALTAKEGSVDADVKGKEAEDGGIDATSNTGGVDSGEAPEAADAEPKSEEPINYPALVISEIQVDGECDGGDWCAALAANVEFIELYNPNDYAVFMEGWRIDRQSTGKDSKRAEFLAFGDIGIDAYEHVVISKNLLEPEDAIVGYLPLKSNGNLSNTGGTLFLVNPDGNIVDMVGWGSSAKSYYGSPAIVPGKDQSIQRCSRDGVLLQGDERNNFAEMLVYKDLGPTPGVGIECPATPVANMCGGLVITEIAANVDNQFIELQNIGVEELDISGCQLQTKNRDTSKTFVFNEGRVVPARDYLAVSIDETPLSLVKTTEDVVYLLASDGETEIEGVKYKNLAKDTSWSLINNEWRQTYQITPGSENIYQQYPPCEAGYWRNEETGRCNKTVEPGKGGGDSSLKPCADDQFRHPETNRCRKIASAEEVADCGEGRERNPLTNRCRNIPTASQLTPCKDGQYRSEETNRCRSIALAGGTLQPCKEGQYRSEETNRCRSIAAVASTLKPCADDQFRNPETNRCKKIASAEELADCGEGRERNPETNRCRNVLAAATIGDVPFAPEQVTQTAQGMAHWWAIGGLSLLALAYAGWQWRFEVSRLTKRVAGVFVAGKK